MREETTINTPLDITILLENYTKTNRPANLLTVLYQIEEIFNIFIIEIEAKREFRTKYLDHWRQLTSLKAVVENLRANSKDNSLEWKHQLPYLKLIKGVWEPIRIFLAALEP